MNHKHVPLSPCCSTPILYSSPPHLACTPKHHLMLLPICYPTLLNHAQLFLILKYYLTPIIPGSAITPAYAPILSPKLLVIANPGISILASHTLNGPIGCP